jgi:hypothetical protein
MNEPRELNTEFVLACMRHALRAYCRDNGVDFVPSADLDPTSYYGFAPADVAMVHAYKHDAGAGTWFRLHDGRVFDRAGVPDDPDPALYDMWTT